MAATALSHHHNAQRRVVKAAPEPPKDPDTLAKLAADAFDLTLMALPLTINHKWIGDTRPLVTQIYAAIQRGEYAAAQELAGSVDFIPALEKVALVMEGFAKRAIYTGQVFAHTDDGELPNEKTPVLLLAAG